MSIILRKVNDTNVQREKGNDTNVQWIKNLEERTSKFQSQYTGRVSSLEKAIASGSHSMPTATPSRGIEVAMS